MPRVVSAQVNAAANARETGIILLQALDIALPNGTTLYVVNNSEDVSINGQTYTAVGFQFDMPEETEDGFSTARMAIDNVEQWLTPHIRSLSGPVDCTFRVVSQSDLTATPPEFDNVDFLSRPLRLKDVTYDRQTMRGVLSYNDTAKNSYPHYGFTPPHFPGMF
jgi:hypothetical protein